MNHKATSLRGHSRFLLSLFLGVCSSLVVLNQARALVPDHVLQGTGPYEYLGLKMFLEDVPAGVSPGVFAPITTPVPIGGYLWPGSVVREYEGGNYSIAGTFEHYDGPFEGTLVRFGESVVAVGDTVVISAPDGANQRGEVLCYDRLSGALTNIVSSIQTYDVIGARLISVGDISSDGNPDFAVSSNNWERIYTFNCSDGVLTERVQELGEPGFGGRSVLSVAVGSNWYVVVNSETKIFVYSVDQQTGVFSEVAEIMPSLNGGNIRALAVRGETSQSFLLVALAVGANIGSQLGSQSIPFGIGSQFIPFGISESAQGVQYVEGPRVSYAGSLLNPQIFTNYGTTYYAAAQRGSSWVFPAEVVFFNPVSGELVGRESEPNPILQSTGFGETFHTFPNPSDAQQSLAFVGIPRETPPSQVVNGVGQNHGAIAIYSSPARLGQRTSHGEGCGVSGPITTWTDIVSEGAPFSIYGQGFSWNTSFATLYLATVGPSFTLSCGAPAFDLASLVPALVVPVVNGRVLLSGLVLPVGTAGPNGLNLCYLLAAPEPTSLGVGFSNLACITPNEAAWGL